MSPFLDLRGLSPRKRGEARGEHVRQAIVDSVARRCERFEESSRWAHWAGLQGWLGPETREELEGVAAAAGVEPAELALCLDEDAGLGPHERGDPGTVALYVVSESGGVLGQTLDVDERDAYPVMAWAFGSPGAERLAVGHPGGLGHCGVRRGLAVSCNPLVGSRAPAGVGQAPWSAIGRALVSASSLGQARGVLDRLGQARGNWHVMLAAVGHDTTPDFSGLECSEQRLVRTQSGPQTGHVHASHYFDPVQRKDEALRSNASWNRLERATTGYAQHRPSTLEALAGFLTRFVWERGPRATQAVAAFEVATGRAELVFHPEQSPVSVTLD